MLKKKITFDEILPFLLAFLLPILIMIGVFAGKGIYPFGERSFLRTDLYHQYIAFFKNFSERVSEGKSLTYAWDIGLGTNYTALFAYYLSGPLCFVAALIPTEHMIEFITYAIVLKIGLCGLTMAWYLSKHFKTHHMAIAFCGICYALSGYMAAYSWNIMWLDVLWLAPIVLYGVELIIEKNSPFLYCISLGFAILCNYYISIMLCIFLVLYFLTRLFAAPKMSFKDAMIKCLLFGVFSLLAGALSGVLLVPAAYALSGTASANTTFPKTYNNYFSILEMVARHLVVVPVETGLDHWPNLYSGVAIFLFLPLYYMNKEVSYREKIANTILILILFISFNTNILNYIWHGFHYPNSLPCRQSYLYTFLVMVMCFEGIRGIDKQPKNKIVGVGWAVVILMLVVEVVTEDAEIPSYAVYASMAFVALYALTAYLYKTRALQTMGAVAMAVCLLIVEMGLNTAVTSVTTVNRTDFMNYDDNYDALEAVAKDGWDFTRMERYSLRTKNDGPYFGYNSASIFSSTTNALISSFYKKIGLEGNTNAYAATGISPVMASLLSVSHLIADKQIPESPLYRFQASAKAHNGGTSYLYEYYYTLPLGYLVPDDTNRLWLGNGSTPAKSQNSLINITTGVSNIWEQVQSGVNGAVLKGTLNEDGHVYVYISSTSVSKVTATVNDANSRTWTNVNRGYMIDMGYCHAGDTVSVKATDSSSISGYIYRLNTERFIEAFEILNSHPLEITEFTDTRALTQVTGTVSTESPALLATSIPYDAGWTVRVDGQVVPVEKYLDAFLSVQIPAGDHEVSFTFYPEGLSLGIQISLLALAILLLDLAGVMIVRLLRSRRKAGAGDAGEISETGNGGREALSLKERMALLHELDEIEYDRERHSQKKRASAAPPPKEEPEPAPAAFPFIALSSEEELLSEDAPEKEAEPASEEEWIAAAWKEAEPAPEEYEEPAREEYQEPAHEEYQEPAPEEYEEPAREEYYEPAPREEAIAAAAVVLPVKEADASAAETPEETPAEKQATEPEEAQATEPEEAPETFEDTAAAAAAIIAGAVAEAARPGSDHSEEAPEPVTDTAAEAAALIADAVADAANPAPEPIEEAPAPAADIQEAPAPAEEIVAAEPEPAPVIVEKAPAPVIVEEAPAPEIIEEAPAPIIVEEAPAPEIIEEAPAPAVPSASAVTKKYGDAIQDPVVAESLSRAEDLLSQAEAFLNQAMERMHKDN